MQYRKVRSAAKHVEPRGKKLTTKIRNTLQTIADVVGATLGPGGRSVLIERYEHDLPPIVTKDGVTVFRALGFRDPIAQTLMESARDVASRTATDAGDGTTTATILANALVSSTLDFCDFNRAYSPQKIVREVERLFASDIEPCLRELAVGADLASSAGQKVLRDVATISANGDVDLAGAVIECFRKCGDEGNVTIREVIGPSRYQVSIIDGYPIPSGYDESCGTLQTIFINDPKTQKVVLEDPLFVLFHGRLNDPNPVLRVLQLIGIHAFDGSCSRNVVIVAHGFSDEVKSILSVNFAAPRAIKPFPLLTRQTMIPNSPLAMLEDLAAITGAEVFDPVNRPLSSCKMEDLGLKKMTDDVNKVTWKGDMRVFEASRSTANLIGRTQDEDRLLVRIDELKALKANSVSELDESFLQDRIAKLSGGIAQLNVCGSSNAETKEKRDRAEDAICSVRGAIRHGCIYGGGWGLLQVSKRLCNNHPDSVIVNEILAPSLEAPVRQLLANVGLDEDEIHEILGKIKKAQRPLIYDALNMCLVDPQEAGIYDALPAVLEAVRNAISIGSSHGTLGGAVVFLPDDALERSEAQEQIAFDRSLENDGDGPSPADERP